MAKSGEITACSLCQESINKKAAELNTTWKYLAISAAILAFGTLGVLGLAAHIHHVKLTSPLMRKMTVCTLSSVLVITLSLLGIGLWQQIQKTREAVKILKNCSIDHQVREE